MFKITKGTQGYFDELKNRIFETSQIMPSCSPLERQGFYHKLNKKSFSVWFCDGSVGRGNPIYMVWTGVIIKLKKNSYIVHYTGAPPVFWSFILGFGLISVFNESGELSIGGLAIFLAFTSLLLFSSQKRREKIKVYARETIESVAESR
ncbi:MAG: hypothetical protein IKL44_01160 [Clostridia bacterium]|nr:hypothetical protein [Clostridia bacterium]